jgi:hypothetical protein
MASSQAVPRRPRPQPGRRTMSTDEHSVGARATIATAMTPQVLLKVINPASAYMHDMDRRWRLESRDPGHGSGHPASRGEDRSPIDPAGAEAPLAPLALPDALVAAGWVERSTELDEIYRLEAERGAKELLARGVATVPTHAGTLTARLVRFWNGTAIVEQEQTRGGRLRSAGASLLDRRTLHEPEPFLARTLLGKIREMDRDAAPQSWGPPPPPQPRTLSPGGWEPPLGVRPMWNWTPLRGGTPRPDLMPWWVKVWYRTPFIDRWAHAWMWRHGGWEVEPPPGPSDGPGEPSGDREPRRPTPPNGLAHWVAQEDPNV